MPVEGTLLLGGSFRVGDGAVSTPTSSDDGFESLYPLSRGRKVSNETDFEARKTGERGATSSG